MTVPFKNFIYNEERKFIFAYVPKVACTNWKSLLRFMAGESDWLDKTRAHGKIDAGLRYLDLTSPEKNLLDDLTISKFAMVRNPYSRILSAYLDKVERRLPLGPESEHEDHFTKITRNIEAFRTSTLDIEKYPQVDLEVFLLWIRDSTSWIRRDEHWATQSELLHQPDTKFDLLARFETLALDAPRILDAMRCDQRFPTQEDIKFAPTSATSKLNRYITPACKSLVETVFDADFVNFKYAKKLPSVR